MKTLLTLILSIICAQVCVAQKVVTLNNDITISLPTEAIPVSKAKASSHLLNEMKSTKAAADEIASRTSQNIYIVKNKLLSLNGMKASTSADHVNKTKKGLDELFKNNTTYTSYIQKYPDKSVLVVSYIANDVKYFQFFAYSAKLDKASTGTLECKINDVEGNTLIKKLISDLKFK